MIRPKRRRAKSGADVRSIDRYIATRTDGEVDESAVEGSTLLVRQEWAQLLAEDRHQLRFGRRVLAACAFCVLLGVVLLTVTDPRWAASIAAFALTLVLVYTLSFTVLGPWLTARRLTPNDLTLRWHADQAGLAVDRGGVVDTFTWEQTRLVVRRAGLLAIHLRARGGVIAVPSRALTPSETARIEAWAATRGAVLLDRQ